MTIFVTGATGYLGSYVVNDLLERDAPRLALLVRANNRDRAIEKLWTAWQLHMGPERFRDALSRVELVYGDLTAPKLGIEEAQYDRLARETESVLHIAATLNRNSERSCLNVNLRGTLQVLHLARRIADHHGLRRFSQVSTVAVAGERDGETVTEDEAIDWSRRDYDPYGRTKKFCEHMTRELLPDVPLTFFRPSMAIGDSRFPQTTQFDMIRAVCFLADLPVVPVGAETREDIVNADFVGHAIATLHMKDRTDHDTYHLSAGTSAPTAGQIAKAIFAPGTGNPGRPPIHAPWLKESTQKLVENVSRSTRRNTVTGLAALLKVFLPYVTYDTVFDNTRVTRELGVAPVPFTEYAATAYRWAKQVCFRYPHRPLPAGPSSATVRGTGRGLELDGAAAE